MALATTWGNFNKITDQGLDVRYECQNVWWSGDNTHDPQYLYSRIRRICTKSYKFIGLTKAAAEMCRTEKIRQYSRNYAAWTVTERTYQKGTVPYAWINMIWNFSCKASIQVKPIEGDDYEVTVQVNEEDTTIARGPQNSIEELEALFAFASIRDYDEDESVPALAVLEASFGNVSKTLSVRFASNIGDFDSAKLKVQHTGPDPDVWTDYLSATVSGEYVTVSGASASKIRLVYDGTVVSNAVDPERFETIRLLSVEVAGTQATARVVTDIAGASAANMYLAYEVDPVDAGWWTTASYSNWTIVANLPSARPAGTIIKVKAQYYTSTASVLSNEVSVAV